MARTPSSPDTPRGIRCPRCSCRHFWVLTTEPAPRNRIRRYRECRHCGYRLTTYEVTAADVRPS